jgi:hypothetical protein
VQGGGTPDALPLGVLRVGDDAHSRLTPMTIASVRIYYWSEDKDLQRKLTQTHWGLLGAVAEVENKGLKHPATGPGSFAEQVVFMRRAYQLR